MRGHKMAIYPSNDGNDGNDIQVVVHDYADLSEHSDSETEIPDEYEGNSQPSANTKDEIIIIMNNFADALVTLGYCGAAVPSKVLNDGTTEWVIPLNILVLGLETLEDYASQIIESNINENYITNYVTNTLDIRESYENNLTPGAWDSNNHPTLYAVFLPNIIKARDTIDSLIIRMSHEYQNNFTPFMDNLNRCINTISNIVENNV
jgi:hypothetical protein